MSLSFATIPHHMRGRREKLFGYGRPVPLDRNGKIRVLTLARALSRRTEPGKAYGILTAKFLAVLGALLWGFHNGRDGRCFPSYEAIAECAGCARSTVYEAIRALEEAGVLTWVNRIVRVREVATDLFGHRTVGWRVERTSNAYSFIDPKPAAGPKNPANAAKSESRTGTPVPVSSSESLGLEAALKRFKSAVNGACRSTKPTSTRLLTA